ncbi:Carbonic anhydrase [Heracleum sosnowskyi]|uniref:Carbonic anhydrase n=1 Tax=Heracleum sosnowskyi TaxID=360622 RepID=A0AAD8NDX6_9APIA|nr:Carbonic anhydrase [Heracleum sosnowskyi]
MATNRLSLLVIAISAVIVTAYATIDADENIEFSYLGEKGPDKWANLAPTFKACRDGKAQSPINIVQGKTTPGNTNTTFDKSYSSANATLVNNGFNVAVHFEEIAGVMTVDGKNYSFLQMHWHTPSEHQMEGKSSDAELQLVHKAQDGSIAIGVILYNVGNGDTFLARIQGKLKELDGEKCGIDEHSHISLGKIGTKQLRTSTRKFYRYNGSITAPPCTENVTWIIFGKTRGISKQQIELLKAPMEPAFKNNSRPVQPDNGRVVELNNALKKD